MNKELCLEEAMSHIKSGMTLMVNGFLGVKSPETVIDAILERGLKDLTLIANDTSMPGVGVSKLIAQHRVKSLYTSHIGTNPETGKQMNNGDLDVVLVPQGTLAERIRCGGSGIGGFLTPTGVGTDVENGKKKMSVGGVDYLLEHPLRADVALLKGSVVDRSGNVYYRGTTKNFSQVMAMAADFVIVEAEEIVEIGALGPDMIMTPAIFVDAIVQSGALAGGASLVRDGYAQ